MPKVGGDRCVLILIVTELRKRELSLDPQHSLVWNLCFIMWNREIRLTQSPLIGVK
ncbi:hypothetical protein D3C75_1083840 [compost metagenome]